MAIAIAHTVATTPAQIAEHYQIWPHSVFALDFNADADMVDEMMTAAANEAKYGKEFIGEFNFELFRWRTGTCVGLEIRCDRRLNAGQDEILRDAAERIWLRWHYSK